MNEGKSLKRKLVKQGAATLMISLPSKWVKSNSLTKGDDVSLEEIGNEIHISTESTQLKKETTIKLTGLTESLIRTLITNTYRAGYDKIAVYYNSSEQFKILNEVVSTKLIGFEITKKEKDRCIVENITEPSEGQFETILKKLFMNITSIIENTRYILGDKSISLEEVENPEEVEERIIKYDNFCRRVIMKRKTQSKPEFTWAFLTLIIHAQRELYHLIKSEKKLTVSKETLDLALSISEIWNILQEAYETKNIDKITKIHDKEKELIYKKGYSALQRAKGKESVALYHILASLRNFYQSNSPLLGIL